MANTGLKIYQFLIQVDATTLIPTGLRKANVPGDPDYVLPVADYIDCPIVSWVATDPSCVLSGGINTGFQQFANRARLTNGTLDGYAEANTNGGGLGPYFAPVSNTTACPIPPPPPPPPPVPNLSVTVRIGGVTITGLTGIPYTPAAGAFPIAGTTGEVTGIHGDLPLGASVSISTGGTIPPMPPGIFFMTYKKNGTVISAQPASSGELYNFTLGPILATDQLIFDLST